MKKSSFLFLLVFALIALAVGRAAWAEDPVYWEPADQSYQDLLTPAELDDLLAPIALYPDPLIAQILPAATFVDQVDEAARYVRQYGSYGRIDEMPWDLSVRAIAHYPSVLFMMDQKIEWTAALGQAYINQPQDVMDAIQRLRAIAQAEGNLYSTAQQQVVYEDDMIAIVPATPQYVYVPYYNPDVIYAESYDPSYPFITFSSGFVIGAWLNRDCDWRRHRVYYHGWRGGGWIGRTRPHIHDKRGLYTSRRAATIHVNNRVLQHDTRRYREQLRTDSVRWAERGAAPSPGTRGPAGTRHAPAGIRQGTTGTRQTQQTTRGTRQTQQTTQGTVHTFGGRQRSSAAGGAVTAPSATRQRPSGTGTRSSSTPSARPSTRRSSTPSATAPAPAGTLPGTTAPSGRPARPHSTAPSTTAPATALPGTTAPSPAPVRQPRAATPPRTPTTTDVFRGRDVQKAQPLSNSGYGGYGSGRDANTYRQRGESSRDTIRRVTPAVPRPHAVTPAPGIVAPATPRTVAPAPAPRAVTPAPASVPRVVAPAPAPAPRAVAPAPVTAPRMSVPAPAAAPPTFRPAPAAPMSRPSVTVPSSPAPMGRPGGAGRMR